MEDAIFSIHYPKDKSFQYVKIAIFIILATIFIGALGFGEDSNSIISKVFMFIFGTAFLIVIYEKFLMLLTLDEVVLTDESIVTKKRQNIQQNILYQNVGYKTDVDIGGKIKISFYNMQTNKNFFAFKETEVLAEEYQQFILLLSQRANLDKNQLTSSTYGQVLPLMQNGDKQISDGEAIYWQKKAFFESYGWAVYILVGLLMLLTFIVLKK